MKRKIVNFSKKVLKGLKKSEEKFIQDIGYGISSSGSCLISNIARSLNENIKIKNTVERLCDNLNSFDNTEDVYNNYINTIGDIYGKEPVALFDDSDISKSYGVIKVVRLYFSRWRIEEYFGAKKQEYEFENIRLRTLKGINNLNLFLTIHLNHINKLAEEINTKLLSIKIIEASKSIRNKVIVWMSQFARGIKKILSYAHTGIKEWQQIEIRDKYKQLELKL